MYENPYTQFDWNHSFQREPSSYTALFEQGHSQSTVDRNPNSVILKDIFSDLYLYWKYIYFEYNSHNGRTVLSFLYKSNNNTLLVNTLHPSSPQSLLDSAFHLLYKMDSIKHLLFHQSLEATATYASSLNTTNSFQTKPSYSQYSL